MWGLKNRDCPNAEGMNDDVSIENILIGCETDEQGFKCTLSVDILSSLTEPEQVFLSAKMADHSGLKQRIGQGTFPLYWFELHPGSTMQTVEMTGYLPYHPADMKRFRVKLKRGKGDTLACKVISHFPQDEDEDEYSKAECGTSVECTGGFCNFDMGSHGYCESCSDFTSVERCRSDGFPDKGADACAAECFDAPTF